MTGLTWLHLSDWHQKGPDFDRDVVRDALIEDIRDRSTRIDQSLAQVDFVVFSGDLAFGGKPTEYEAAWQHLLGPVMGAVGLKPDRLFIVPGNHDLSRDHVYEMLPQELQHPLNTDALVQKWLDDQKRARAMEPFEAFRAFVTNHTGQATPDYASIQRLTVGGRRVVLMGLNTAWMCARHMDHQGEVDDARHLVVGEPQIHNMLAQIADAEVKIVVMHHPFDWLAEFDRNRIEARLGRECHFILRGHEHQSQVQVMRGTGGDCVIIPAGASYKRRITADPRYTNAYNCVHLDFEAGQGTVFLRRWSDPRNEWIEDTDAHPGGKFLLMPLPKDLGARPPASLPPDTLTLTPSSRFEGQRAVLEGYLGALLRNNSDLDPRGIKTTKAQVVLPLDEIYVGLLADRDRPDVDRRVMQEELDEIKKRLEREDDPKEREKQYQIWANQARILEQALEVSGPREELSDIVQRQRQVVILGDPGSGKTTLVRYLTLCFARAILAEPERIFEPQDLWDVKNIWRLPALGPVRLPILVRIANYSEARQKDPDLSLLDYLPRYFAGLQIPNAEELGPLLQGLLEAGRCVVLLDGLDEIIDQADRRNIATAIGQFAGVYRETGLPDWLARSLAFAPALVGKPEPDAEAKEEEILVAWSKNVPEDVREGWDKQIKQGGKRWRARGRHAQQLAWELLREARYAHVGNRFVVTSRIAGYHFAGVPGEFEHYVIRRMSPEDIKRFLEKWCPAVERRIAEAPDPTQVEQRARREIDGILQAVETTAGVRRMAENPLLLRILAIIHRNEAHLPQRRVELYETATITLLRDWNLERGAKGAVIDDARATSLLGPVAFHIHEKYASGFLSKGETEQFLAGILASERGEDPEQPSLATREAVEQFLEMVREHSGLFVERGEGLYGFMHLTFEEYFTARHLVSSSARARPQILVRLHLPRWREPILLAVGSLSKQFYDDTHDLLQAILEAGSSYEGVLHRDLLFAAACVGDSVNVALRLRQEIARRLLIIYCDRRHAGRYRLLQNQVKEALLILCNDQGDAAVEAALAATLTACPDQISLACALDAVDWLKARTSAVADALASCCDPSVMPRVQELLRAVQGRLPLNGNGAGARLARTGWDAIREDTAVARLLGVVWHYGWSYFLVSSLGIRQDAVDNATRELSPLLSQQAVASARSLLKRFSDTPIDQRDTKFWDAIASMLQAVWREAPRGGEMEVASGRLMKAVAAWLENQDDAKVVTRQLYDFMIDRAHFREDEAKWPGTILVDEALTQFQAAVGEAERALAALDFDHVFQSAGSYLLIAASTGHTLAAAFAAAAERFGSVRHKPEDDTLRDSVHTLQSEICNTLLAWLRSTASGQQYQEVTLFLAFPSTDSLRSSLNPESEEGRLSAEVAAIIGADLDGADAVRRSWALQALTSSAIRKRFELTDGRCALLVGLLDGPVDQAKLALDILSCLSIRSDLLAWCWSVLRCPDHPLADAVRERLEGAKAIRGTGPILAMLDEGLRDQSLRKVSIELLREVSLAGPEAFAFAITWLAGEDTDVRSLAAVLLAKADPPSVLRNVLVNTATEKLKDSGESAASLCDDAPLVRLLGGLWLHGWDEALTQLWFGQPAVAYVDKQHPTGYWRSFRTYPQSEECIRWLLKKGLFDQILIPTFQNAAGRLTELEGDSSQDAPHAEHIATVQQEISQQINALLTHPDSSSLLAAQAAIFDAAARGETIPSVPTTALKAALERADGPDWTAVLRGLGQLSELDPWLRSLVRANGDSPLAVWLSQTLALHGLTLSDLPAVLANLLIAESPDARLAASLTLLGADLQSLLVEALVEATQSADDRVRMTGRSSLSTVCASVATDGSTEAVELLLRFVRDAVVAKDGPLGTVLTGAFSSVKHIQPFLIVRWLEGMAQEDEPTHNEARQGLSEVHWVSAEVLSLICAALDDPTLSSAAHRAVIDSLVTILRSDAKFRSDPMIQIALTKALDDADAQSRRRAAYALQWTVGEGAWTAIQALLRAAQSDPDAQTRAQTLRSAGRVLHAGRQREVDVSKEALLRWLAVQCKERQTPKIEEAVKRLANLAVLKEAPDAGSALDKMTHPDNLGLPDHIASWLGGSSQGWDNLLQGAREEWAFRHNWLVTQPNLTATIAQVEALLSSPEPFMRPAAACALARIYHGEDDRPTRLSDLLCDEAATLQSLLDAVTDPEDWIDEGEGRVSHHPLAVKQVASWVEAQPPEERTRLIAGMLDNLGCVLDERDRNDSEEDNVYGDDTWCQRRILVAVLAELSERLTYRAFSKQRTLTDVVNLFARAAADPESYNTRRFAIRALGNLQQFTSQVADVFFAACQDVGHVYRETRTAVTKFNVFGAGSLERLTAAIRSPSITVAYHSALLLGELGVSRSEALGREGRKRVADELVQLLGDPLSERIVYDLSKGGDGERVGPLYDVIYEALTRVVAGPDAPTAQVATQ